MAKKALGYSVRRACSRLPVFCAPWRGVKGKLYPVRGKYEPKGYRFLAGSRAQLSESSDMFTGRILVGKGLGRLLKRMEHDRVLHAKFRNLLGATRFTTAEGRELRHTICPNCKKLGSRQRCLGCYKIASEPPVGEKIAR